MYFVCIWLGAFFFFDNRGKCTATIFGTKKFVSDPENSNLFKTVRPFSKPFAQAFLILFFFEFFLNKTVLAEQKCATIGHKVFFFSIAFVSIVVKRWHSETARDTIYDEHIISVIKFDIRAVRKLYAQRNANLKIMTSNIPLNKQQIIEHVC